MPQKPSYLQDRSGRGRGRGRSLGVPIYPFGDAEGVERVVPGRSVPSNSAPQQRFDAAAATHQASIKQCVDNDAFSSSDSDSDMEFDAIMFSMTDRFKQGGNGHFPKPLAPFINRFVIEFDVTFMLRCLI